MDRVNKEVDIEKVKIEIIVYNIKEILGIYH